MPARNILAALVLVLVSASAKTAGSVSPRERISINDDWRFMKGDPPGVAGNLAYEQIKTVDPADRQCLH